MTTFEAALDYHSRGYAVLPIPLGTKKTTVSWKRYQNKGPDLERLKIWFGKADLSIAILLGDVSGGLVVRDFDVLASYQQWAQERPRLAETLPTVETARGYHVYVRADPEQVRRHSKPGTKGMILDMGDGELKAGGYVLAPPSVHPCGKPYRWAVPLPAGQIQIPFVDLAEVGFLDFGHELQSPNTTNRRSTEEEQKKHRGETEENRGIPKSTEAIGGVCVFVSAAVCAPPENGRQSPEWAAILETLPTGPGRRDRQVFKLAWSLKALPILAGGPVGDLKPIVREWHRLALPVIGTKPFELTWISFKRAWPRVKFPKGTDPMPQILQASLRMGTPAVAEQYEGEEIRLLVGLCRELQRSAGDGEFYLSCRKAGELIGTDYKTAWEYLWLLKEDGILAAVTVGSYVTKKATRWRYLAPL